MYAISLIVTVHFAFSLQEGILLSYLFSCFSSYRGGRGWCRLEDGTDVWLLRARVWCPPGSSMPGGQHRAASALADPILPLRGASLPCSSSISYFRLSEGGRGQGEATMGRAFHTSKPCLVRRSWGCLAVLSHRDQGSIKMMQRSFFCFPTPLDLGQLGTAENMGSPGTLHTQF